MPSAAPPAAPSTHVRAVLRRWDQGHWADWLVPALLAAVWGLLLVRAIGSGAMGLVRSLVFVGGPALLLAGLHGRLGGYLHAPSRMVLMPLPLPPREHFRSARRRHVRGSLATLGLGTVAVAGPAVVGLGFGPQAFGLVVDWLSVAVASVGVEPLIAATSSWAGRRFAEDHVVHRLQRSMGGGWTLPEAVVHLYAPALGVGLCAALAMPAQLGVDLWIDGAPVPSALWGIAVAGGLAALLAYAVSPALYARGFFQAAPFLAEATRSLAGPPEPDPLPGFVARIRDPQVRLLVAQYWRLTPVPSLRLWMLIGTAGWAAVTGVDLAKACVVLVVALLWVVPASAVVRAAEQRARLLASLPVSPRAIAGARGRAVGWLALPVVLAMTTLGLAWSLS